MSLQSFLSCSIQKLMTPTKRETDGFIPTPKLKIVQIEIQTLTWNSLSKFLRRSLLIFIINVFRTIVFIFIVISTTFRTICPPAFFKCLSVSLVRQTPEEGRRTYRPKRCENNNKDEYKMNTKVLKPLMIKTLVKDLNLSLRFQIEQINIFI